jgi:hypothetical protein
MGVRCIRRLRSSGCCGPMHPRPRGVQGTAWQCESAHFGKHDVSGPDFLAVARPQLSLLGAL